MSRAMLSILRKSSISKDSSGISIPNWSSISNRKVTSATESSSPASMMSVCGAGAERLKVSSKMRWIRAVIWRSISPRLVPEPYLDHPAGGSYDSPPGASLLGESWGS
jgi:hypothetical protein